MSFLKDNIVLGMLAEDICSAKGYAKFYHKTKYSRFSDKELCTVINDTEKFLSMPEKDILEIFKEISTRFSKNMGVPVKKIELENGEYAAEDGVYYNARLNYGDTNKMYFSTYPVELFKKIREKYQLDNYLFSIAHENRHAYQFYKFGHCNKNDNQYSEINFMRNEQIMRYFLSSIEGSMPKNDYQFNSLERDANFYAISFYMDLISNNKIEINKDNLEFIIEEMLDYNEIIDGKKSSQLQMENYVSIFNSFQHNINPKVFEKFAKKRDLESESEFISMQNSVIEKENNVDRYLMDCLQVYYNLVNRLVPNGYSQERFLELQNTKDYNLIYNELFLVLEESGLNLKPTTSIKESEEETFGLN